MSPVLTPTVWPGGSPSKVVTETLPAGDDWEPRDVALLKCGRLPHPQAFLYPVVRGRQPARWPHCHPDPALGLELPACHLPSSLWATACAPWRGGRMPLLGSYEET